MTEDRERYGRLACNLCIAFMAHRLGVRMATEERKTDYYSPETIGGEWIAYAKAIEQAHLAALDKMMRDYHQSNEAKGPVQ